MPMLGRTITLVAVLQVIASLKIFDQVYLITQGYYVRGLMSGAVR